MHAHLATAVGVGYRVGRWALNGRPGGALSPAQPCLGPSLIDMGSQSCAPHSATGGSLDVSSRPARPAPCPQMPTGVGAVGRTTSGR